MWVSLSIHLNSVNSKVNRFITNLYFASNILALQKLKKAFCFKLSLLVVLALYKVVLKGFIYARTLDLFQSMMLCNHKKTQKTPKLSSNVFTCHTDMIWHWQLVCVQHLSCSHVHDPPLFSHLWLCHQFPPKYMHVRSSMPVSISRFYSLLSYVA